MAWTVLVAVAAVSLIVRWTLLDDRWINPDEGAHLMDAWLALQGYVPEVDIGTRQPLYVYALAGTLKIFGATLAAGRIFPLACSVLTGFMIYLLGTALIDRRIGLLASCVYLLLPLEILQSPVVKTEAPVTLLIVSSLYAAVAAEHSQRAVLFVLAGILAAAGYYVRETALLVPAVVAVFFFVARGWRGLLKPLGLFAAGYAAALLLVTALYAPSLSAGDLWLMLPLSFAVNALARLGAYILPGPDEPGLPAVASWQGFGESPSLYAAYMRDAVFLHGFLFVGLALAGWYVWQRRPADERELLRQERTAFVTLSAWLAAIGGMYGYRYIGRGFFIDYFREFLPPLVLLFAVGLCAAAPAFRDGRNVVRLLLLALPLGALCLVLQGRFPQQIGIGHHANLAAAGLGALVVAFSGDSDAKRWRFATLLLAVAAWTVVSRLIAPSLFGGMLPAALTMLVILLIVGIWYQAAGARPVRSTIRFASWSVMAAAFVLGVSYSALRLSIRYEAVWPPHEAEAIAQVIAGATEEEAEVISGAVIWELMAHRYPFQLITHPLIMKRQLSADDREELAEAILSDPPEIVVLDGYTEVTYARNVPELHMLVSRSYTQLWKSNEGLRPVSVYQRVDSGSVSRVREKS